jgi:transposase
VVFLDESGFQMTPVVRRTYAPRGKTPIVEAFFRKGKISAISAVTVSPVRRRCGLSFQLLADNANAHGEETVAFLAQLRRRLQGPMTILWDQSKIHQRSGVVRKYLAKHPEVVTEEFPGYAPDANPDEGVWGWTKYHRLPNFAPEDLTELRSRLHSELSSLSKRGDLLASFIRHAKVPLRL